jgi:hypothetical protein
MGDQDLQPVTAAEVASDNRLGEALQNRAQY